MKIPVKKLKNGFEIPVFGIGAYRMGGDTTHDTSNDDQRDISAIKKAIDMGITHIDTAEMYGGGHSEKIVGKAIKGYDRSSLIIATKVSPMSLHYGDVIAAAKNSLKRLDTDYIDLYLIHYPNFKIPIKETMETMDYLLEKNIIRYIGVSNFNIEQFKKAQSCTRNKIVVNQIPYSLKNRMAQKDGFLNYAQTHDVMVAAWRPIEGGMLSKNKVHIVDNICKKYNKTPSQIAINWLISQDNVVTIPGSRNIKHLEENLGSLGWQLNQEDFRMLDEKFPEKEYFSLADDYWLKQL
jgi:diketogulonate reductase-like aldo/keto reductase